MTTFCTAFYESYLSTSVADPCILGWIRIWIRGSMALNNGSGFGSGCGSGSYYFRHWPSQDANEILIFKKVFLIITFWMYMYIIFKDKKSKKSQSSRNQGFSYFFCWVIEGPDPDPYLGSGSGSRRPKNMWIRIRNTAFYTGTLTENVNIH